MGNTFPLTASQRQMYSAQLLDPDSPLYNTVITNTLYGHLRVSDLSKAWDQVVDNNAALRARIKETSDEPALEFVELNNTLQQLDFSQYADADLQAEQWIRHDSVQLFDLRSILFKAAVIKIRSDKWIWYCNQHHLITDALSFQSIWSQLSWFYDKKHLPATGEFKVGDFRDYIEDHRHQDPDSVSRDRAVLNAHEHWSQRSQGGPVLPYYGRLCANTTRSTRISSLFSDKRLEALDRLVSRSEARSLNLDISRMVVLMTTLYGFLYRVSGQSDITIGSPTAYRADVSHKHSAGPFFEVLPLNTQVLPDDTFASLLKKTRAEIMAWLRHAREGACETAGQAPFR